jgi:hypothetical protein
VSITEQRIADIIEALNAYDQSREYGGVTEPTANNVWQDVILPLPEYGESKTDEIDEGSNDRFALSDGSVIRYDPVGRSWWCSRRGETPTEWEPDKRDLEDWA